MGPFLNARENDIIKKTTNHDHAKIAPEKPVVTNEELKVSRMENMLDAYARYHKINIVDRREKK